VSIIYGDSADILPSLRQQKLTGFDLIHIDGNHKAINVNDDLYHSLCLASSYGYVVLNDCQKSHIGALWEYYNSSGLLLQKSNVFPNKPLAIASHVIGVVDSNAMNEVHQVYIKMAKALYAELKSKSKKIQKQQ
jgi:hypothetical protein